VAVSLALASFLHTSDKGYWESPLTVSVP
jgi:hypothetical protein